MLVTYLAYLTKHGVNFLGEQVVPESSSNNERKLLKKKIELGKNGILELVEGVSELIDILQLRKSPFSTASLMQWPTILLLILLSQ